MWRSWGLFALEGLTVLVLFAVAVTMVGITVGRSRRDEDGQLRVRDLGARQQALSKALQPKRGQDRPKLYVLHFTGDIRATHAVALREEITAVVGVATPRDEVVVRLNNPGGTVHEQGFAASQLLRLRQRDIPLTVCVDTMAASGGYLMACVANRIVAAPFAVVGSIGVIAVVPKVHRLLERAGVDVEQYTAGRYKRTVTPFGATTEDAREKLTEELAQTHELFKSWVAAHRPQVDLDRVATGEHWYGTTALELGLVDEILTSDDYLLRAREERDIVELRYRTRIPVSRRLLGSGVGALVGRRLGGAPLGGS
jgi:serine protease SohB